MAEVIKEDVGTEEEKRRIIEENHDSTLGAVSYTHLDVYKRQI